MRRYFLAGILALAPVSITAWLLLRIFRTVDGWLRPVIARAFGFEVPGVGFVSTVLLVLGVGALVSNVLGRQVFGAFERLFRRVPLASRIYVAVKQIGDSVIGSQRNLFQRVVLFEWPRSGVWAMGFVTAQHEGGFFAETGRAYSHVFLPTTPNPTSGYLLFVADEDLIDLDISVEDGLKLVISGGAVTPAGRAWRASRSAGSPGAGRTQAAGIAE
jgi:uncharacterized membrane protein